MADEFDAHDLAHDLFEGPMREVQNQHDGAQQVIRPHILKCGFDSEEADLLLYLVENATFAGAVLGASHALMAMAKVMPEVAARVNQTLEELMGLAQQNARATLEDPFGEIPVHPSQNPGMN